MFKRIKELVMPNENNEPTRMEVIVENEKHFHIFQDGNGYFRAKHKSGMWLEKPEYLTEFYEFAKKMSSMAEVNENCIYFIKSHQLKEIGTIEFIPKK